MAVKAVKHSSVSGNQIAKIFYSCNPLNHRHTQITVLRQKIGNNSISQQFRKLKMRLIQNVQDGSITKAKYQSSCHACK